MQEQKATTKPSITLSADFWDDPRVLALTEEEKLLYIGLLIMKKRGLVDQLSAIDDDFVMSKLLRTDEQSAANLKNNLMILGLTDGTWQPIEEATTKQSITLSTNFWDDPRVLMLTADESLMYIGVLIMKRRGIVDQLSGEGIDDSNVMARLLRSREDYVDELKEVLVNLGLIDENWQPIAEV